MEYTAMQPRTRNIGIDLLRVVCMFLIPLMHLLVNGGLTLSREPLSGAYIVCECIEILCLCSVNCFGMITGYVSYGHDVKYSSLMVRYAQVLFYTLPVTALFLIFRPELVEGKDVIRALLPFSYYQSYWYFSSYFALFFFIPYLNRIVDQTDRSQLGKLLATCMLVFSILATVSHSDLGDTINGFSTLWLGVMYLLGAYFAKYGTAMRWKNNRNLVICLVSDASLAVLVFGIQFAAKMILHANIMDKYLLYYVSPFVVVSSLGLFLYFANLQCGKRLTRFAQIFGPVTFGVYLFQEEPLLRAHYLLDRLAVIPDWSPLTVGAFAVGLAAAVWLTGSAIDMVRLRLFRFWRLNQRFAELEAFLRQKIGRIPFFQE